MTIDVIVPTFNGWTLTASCLQHLAAQTVSHRVIVSDDGSSDGTPALVRERFPEARVVETGGNQGFVSACNRGASAGDSEVIVLLNNDVNVRPNFLERLVAPLERDASLGSVSAVLVWPDERTIDSIGLFADVTLAGFARHRGRPLAEAGAERPALVGPSGGGAAYRRRAWEALGGLEDDLFMYLEDFDLALRLRAAGWGAAAAPDAIGVHLGSATMGARSARTRYHSGFSRGYLLRAYRVLSSTAGPRAVLTELAVVIADLARSRDALALRGRVDGWRAAKEVERPSPPRETIAHEISFAESLRLRRA